MRLRIALPLLALLSCHGKKTTLPADTAAPPEPADTPRAEPKPGEVALREAQEEGLLFRITEGMPPDEGAVKVPRAKTTPLSADEVKRILARLPAIAIEGGDQKDFALRDKSLPPPRTGETVPGKFPPDVSAPAPGAEESGPLQVLRHQPDGEVPIAPRMSVTFSQPMIAVTAHDDVASVRPVKITPEPPGSWRWVGTKTIVFEPTGRFPMATEYRVEIPAGTKSATGGTLAKAVTFSFATPPVGVEEMQPQHGPVGLEPAIWLKLDQRVDAAAMLAVLKLDGGGKSIALREMTAAELAEEKHLAKRAAALDADGGKGTWLALMPEAKLTPETSYTLRVPAGTPSAEGPRLTTKARDFSFRTYGPMKVTRSECGWNGPCRPLMPWMIELSNPIDAEAFDPSMVVVEPAIKGMNVSVHGNWMNIHGQTKGRTKYTVRLASTLPDVFDQTLGKSDGIKFDVTSAEPSLRGPNDVLTVLDPTGPPRLSVYSINHKKLKLRAYRVASEDWRAWLKYLENVNREDQDFTPPGKEVVDTLIDVAAEADELVETRVDLSQAIKDVGQAIVIIEPTSQPKNRWQRSYVRTWVTATKIGLTAAVDGTDVQVFATSLADGKPLAGVGVRLSPGGASATTGPDGTAVLPLGADAKKQLAIVAEKGNDEALLPHSTYWWGGGEGWRKYQRGQSLHWFVFDDRKMYRPGETVKVKGWIRKLGWNEGGDVAMAEGLGDVDWKLHDSQGNEVRKGSAKISAAGGFDLSFDLPKTMNLGWGQLVLTAPNGGDGRIAHHGIQVEEFRRPEFEVTASHDGGPHFVGGSAIATVRAAYYAGGALPNADVSWRVTAVEGSFTPPNRDDFTFGVWKPWWGRYRYHEYDYKPPKTETLAGKTGSDGAHHLRLEFEGVKPARPQSVTAHAAVMDVNRQAWAATATMLVHPSSLYIGVRSDRLFVQANEKFRLESIVTDVDGKAVPGRKATLTLVRMEWVQEKGQWVEKEKDPTSCEITSAKDAVKCELSPREGGVHKLRAVVTDDRGRANETELTLWVAGGRMEPDRGLRQEEITMIPDKKEYAVGDSAQILLNAPFWPAEGVMTLRRAGVLETRRITMTGPSTTLTVPLREEHIPDVAVHVELVGAATRLDDKGEPQTKLAKRPAFASGELTLSVPPKSRALTVDVKPGDKELEPGGKTDVTVIIRDAAGKPVAGAEVAIVVVDEAVLALSGYSIPDPLAFFHPSRGSGVGDHHARAFVTLTNPLDAPPADPTADNRGDDEGAVGGVVAQRALKKSEATAAPGAPPPPMEAEAKEKSKNGKDKKGGEDAGPIALRTNFDALAFFGAEIPTDAKGAATVSVKLPDNLTRYRVTAVAVMGARRYGKGESTITARLPLMVRPSAPRFLNFGDQFELPVVLQNQTAKPMTVMVAARASNLALEGQGYRVTVPARDRVEVRFPAAADRAGTARFQVGAVSGTWSDAAEASLPVWTPATTEAFATYGVIDKKGEVVRQPVAPPKDAVKQFGFLEITTTSTQLQALTDAVLYLATYPFECTEQLASRILAVASLKDVLAAFDAEGLPPPAELVSAVDRDLDRLKRTQNHDGGWGFWRRGEESWPYLTIHIAHALARAKNKGFTVPTDMTARATGYLRDIRSHIPGWYPPEAKRAIRAYALYVRKQLGDGDAAAARQLLGEVKMDKEMEAVGWIYAALAGDAGSRKELVKLRGHIGNRAVEEAGTAHFVSSYDDGAHLLLASDRRVDGVILEAMILDDPKNDLIPKVVEGLLAHRKRGRWENTNENAFVLIALDLYFHTFEKTTPDFVARAWLGDGYAGDHQFKGRTTERHRVEIPMGFLVEKGASDLTLQKDGAGRMYYRIGMAYAPSSLKLAPSDHGFTVERKYEALDDAKDVSRDKDGTWRIRAGAKVRVRVTMVAPTRRYHVALVDPLPAGLEAVNPTLKVSEHVPSDPAEKQRRGWWWWGPWYEHQNMRDERVEAFTSLLWEGVWDYTYVARATTPGTFVVPPPKAEEMYHPETFGRGGTDRVIVE